MWKNLLRPRARQPAGDALSMNDVPRYPPYAEGLPVVGVEKLLGSQAVLIDQLRTPLGQNKAQFAQRTRPVLLRYAAFVHLLPASEAHHHRGAGGLFRHGLEVALRATLLTEDLLIGMDMEPVDRRRVEPIWKFAVFLAALFHDVGKPVGDLSVTDRAGNTEWNPMEESLVAWAQTHELERYFLHWRRGRHKQHEELAMYIAPGMIGRDTRSYLRDGGPAILQAVVAALAGKNDGIIHPRVQQADEESTERDLRTNPGVPSAGGGADLGVPVENHLRDAMRRLLAAKRWKANQAGARVWVFDDGVYIVWSAAVTDITNLLREDKIPGIPRDKDVLADILIERGVAVPRETETGPKRYWRIAPALLQRDGKSAIELSMLRLIDPAVLFDGPGPPPVARAPEQAPTAHATLEAKDESPGAPNAPAPPAPPAHQPDPSVDTDNREAALVARPDAQRPDTQDEPSDPPPMPPAMETEQDAWMTQTDAEWRAAASNGEAPHAAAPEQEGQAPGRQLHNLQDAICTLEQRGGDAGTLLAWIAEAIRDGALVTGKDFVLEPTVMLAWPRLAKKRGVAPGPLLKALDGLRWVEPNPDKPMARILERHGVRGIQLKGEARDLFQRICQDGAAPVVPMPEPARELAPGPVAKTPPPGPPPPSPCEDKVEQLRGEWPNIDRASAQPVWVEDFIAILRAGTDVPGGVTRKGGYLWTRPMVLRWYCAERQMDNAQRKGFLRQVREEPRIEIDSEAMTLRITEA